MPPYTFQRAESKHLSRYHPFTPLHKHGQVCWKNLHTKHFNHFFALMIHITQPELLNCTEELVKLRYRTILDL